MTSFHSFDNSSFHSFDNSFDNSLIDHNAGITALQSVLTIEKNIKILEAAISKISTNNNDYTDFILTVIHKIKNGEKLNTILKNIKSNQFGFSSPIFNSTKQLLAEQQNFLNKPFEVNEGVLECKCGSNKTISFSKQTRGGDEGTTVFAKCTECGHSWRE